MDFTGDLWLNSPQIYCRLRGSVRRRRLSRRVAPGAGQFQELSVAEGENWMGLPTAIGCATFYEGILPQQQIMERIAAIVDANPWLAGRLVTDRQTKQPVLWVPDVPCAEQSFNLVEDATVHEGMPYDELSKRVAEHGVWPGFLCLDADRPLFKVTIIRCSPERFVLTMSLSHAIADGDTFYQIYRMMDKSQPINLLQPARVQSFAGQAREAVGAHTHDWLSSKRTTCSYFRQHYSFADKNKSPAIYRVNADWLA